MASVPLGVCIGFIALIVGVVIRYGYKHQKLNIGDVIVLIVYSFITGISLVFLVKGFDYIFSGWLYPTPIFNISIADMKGLIVIGSLSGIFAICYFFWKYLVDKHLK